jgi:hypothetical protein
MRCVLGTFAWLAFDLDQVPAFAEKKPRRRPGLSVLGKVRNTPILRARWGPDLICIKSRATCAAG